MKQCNNCGELRAYLNKKGVCIFCKNGETPRGKITNEPDTRNTKVFKGDIGGNFI